MSERDKQTARDIIDAYRRRQQLTQNIILVIGIGAILLIAVVFVVRFTGTGSSPAVEETPTAEVTDAFTTSPTATETLEPSDPLAPLTTEPPELEETPGAPETSTYQVQEGDTLGTIALRFNTDLQTLINLNPDIDPDLLSVGQDVIVPAAQTETETVAPPSEDFGNLIEYQVVSGDTLFSIAERFNSSVNAIVAENNLENANDIRAGDTLLIPSSATQAAPAATSTPGEATTTPLNTETPKS